MCSLNSRKKITKRLTFNCVSVSVPLVLVLATVVQLITNAPTFEAVSLHHSGNRTWIWFPSYIPNLFHIAAPGKITFMDSGLDYTKKNKIHKEADEKQIRSQLLSRKSLSTNISDNVAAHFHLKIHGPMNSADSIFFLSNNKLHCD